MDLATSLYEDAASSKACNRHLEEALTALVASQGAERMCAFEIGAGTGGTTSGLLPRLNPWASRYTFSDLSRVFTQAARVRFAAQYDFVDYCLFDAEVDP